MMAIPPAVRLSAIRDAYRAALVVRNGDVGMARRDVAERLSPDVVGIGEHEWHAAILQPRPPRAPEWTRGGDFAMVALYLEHVGARPEQALREAARLLGVRLNINRAGAGPGYNRPGYNPGQGVISRATVKAAIKKVRPSAPLTTLRLLAEIALARAGRGFVRLPDSVAPQTAHRRRP